MPSVRADKLSGNTNAVLGQPMYLLVVVIVSAVIITLLIFSFQAVIADAQTHQIESEINTILTQATTMYEYADDASYSTVHVEFPPSMRFVVFGGVPDNNPDNEPNLTLDEKTSNNYYYVMSDGRVFCFHTNARFSSQNLTKKSIVSTGVHDLNLELTSHEGKIYVKIY
jgi:hypothetical protein